MKKFLTLLVAAMLSSFAFADLIQVATWNECSAALKAEGTNTVQLTADMHLNWDYYHQNFKGVKVLDLNGHSVTSNSYVLHFSTPADSIIITGNGTWTSSGAYCFSTSGDNSIEGGRDNGNLIIENGLFNHTGNYNFMWIGENGLSTPKITINGGIFYTSDKDKGEAWSSSNSLIYSSNGGPIVTINDGVFIMRNEGSAFTIFNTHGGELHLNGGTYFNRYKYAHGVMVGDKNSNFFLGEGKVVYVNGVKKTDVDFKTIAPGDGKLVQISDAATEDTDYVTASLTTSDASKGKGYFGLNYYSYDNKKPTSIKVLKNTNFDIPIEAKALESCKFTGWSNYSGATPARTDTAYTTIRIGDSDATVQANFETKPLHKITQVAEGGTIRKGYYDPSALDSAYQGKQVNYYFWVNDGYLPVSASVVDENGNNISVSFGKASYRPLSRSGYFTMPDADVTFTAIAKPERKVTVAAADHGTVIIDTARVYEGYTVNLTITPDADYRLKSLVVTNASTQEKVATTGDQFAMSFIMPDADVTVTPAFELIPSYAISIGSMTGGSVASSPAGSARPDSLITLTITENPGYTLESISVKQGNTDVTLTEVDALHRTFIMPEGDVTVSATFDASITFAITKVIAGSGSGVAEISQTEANVGREIIVTATPNELNYVASIVVVTVVGNDTIPVTDNKFTMPAVPVTVTITFEPFAVVNAATYEEVQSGMKSVIPTIVRLSADMHLNWDYYHQNVVGIKILDLNGKSVTATSFLLHHSTPADSIIITGNCTWTSSGAYCFSTKGDNAIEGGRDNGKLIIENGTFIHLGNYNFFWIGEDGFSKPVITINGGTFHITNPEKPSTYHNNNSLIYSSNGGPMVTINDGVFISSNEGSMFTIFNTHGGEIHLNGGTFYNRYIYRDYVMNDKNSNYFLGEGKVVYVNGVKNTTWDLQTNYAGEGRLIQIGNSDSDFVEATITASTGGKAGFNTRMYSDDYPKTMKLLKNCAFDLPVKASANTHYSFVEWSDISGTTLAATDMAETTLRVGSSDIALKANFVIDHFAVAVTAVNGSVKIGDEVGTKEGDVYSWQIAYGTEIVLTAEPATGYNFVKWSDEETTAAHSAITVDADIELTAIFEEDPGTGIDEVQSDKVQSTKVLRDGQLFIIRDGKIYNAIGVEIK